MNGEATAVYYCDEHEWWNSKKVCPSCRIAELEAGRAYRYVKELHGQIVELEKAYFYMTEEIEELTTKRDEITELAVDRGLRIGQLEAENKKLRVAVDRLGLADPDIVWRTLDE